MMGGRLKDTGMFVKCLKNRKGHLNDHAVDYGALPARSSGSFAMASNHPFGFEKGGVFLIGPQDMLVEPVFQEIGNLDRAGNG
jgi:hypothetical protein